MRILPSLEGTWVYDIEAKCYRVNFFKDTIVNVGERTLVTVAIWSQESLPKGSAGCERSDAGISPTSDGGGGRKL